jgi:hypothetical protein
MKIYVFVHRWDRRQRRQVPVEYRCDPIPHTGRRRRFRYMRHPRTTNERRAYFHDEISEYQIRVRGRRTSKNLPEAWDDMLRSDTYNHKNWKHHRRHQWKVDIDMNMMVY